MTSDANPNPGSPTPPTTSAATPPNASRTATRRFVYRAQTADGLPALGSIEATDHDHARILLAQMRLRLTDLAEEDKPARAAPLNATEFMAFNQQLAHLTQAGLPIEAGLRLIAAETRRPGVAAAIRQVADELEQGHPLPEVFAAHRRQFPALYGRLMDAGVRSSNLPAMLFNLGRHMDLIHRMRATLWQALAYPMVAMVVLAAIVTMLGWFVLPEFKKIFDDFGTELPSLTKLLMNMIPLVPWLLGVVVMIIVGGPTLWRILCAVDMEAPVIDGLVLPMPLLGQVIKRALLARWCDATRLGVEAGLDLPSAMSLAGDAIGFPSLQRDTNLMISALSAGQPLASVTGTRLINDATRATIDMSSRQGNLPAALETLTRLNADQAEIRVSALGVILMPAALLIIGIVVGFIVLALFLPIVRCISSLT